MTRRALVLGAGGNAAIAWEIGCLAGLADRGVDVADADIVVGTSAGSIVGAQITSGCSIEELFQRQVDLRLQVKEPSLPIDFVQWRADVARAKENAATPAEFLQAMGSFGSRVATEESNRRRIIAERLPRHIWPDMRLLVAAVDVDRGTRTVFDSDSGVPLIDAVAASCSVAGIWPAVVIDGRRYVDGGFYSVDNADLAAGAERVLILALPPRVPSFCVQSLAGAVEMLRRQGAIVETVHPDQASLDAIASVGGNLLDPAVREPMARAGREQGRTIADRLDDFWATASTQ
jgi:NTE family protein